MKYLNVKYINTGSIVDFWKRTPKQQLGNCERCGRFTDYDNHEPITRARGGTVSVRICRECHSWIGEHIGEAEKEGFYARGYKLNDTKHGENKSK